MYSNTVLSIAPNARTGKATRVVSALAVAFALTFASGCALLSDNLEKAAKSAGKVVKSYCENVTAQEVRDEIRDAINVQAAPHKLEVTCADQVAATPSQ